MSTQDIVSVLTAVGVVVSYFIGHFAGKRITNANAQKSELSNVEDAIKIWRDLAEDFAAKLKTAQDDYSKIYEQNVAITQQNTLLLKKVTRLEKDIDLMTKTR